MITGGDGNFVFTIKSNGLGIEHVEMPMIMEMSVSMIALNLWDGNIWNVVQNLSS